MGIVHAELRAVEDEDRVADGGEMSWAGDMGGEEYGGGDVFDSEHGGGRAAGGGGGEANEGGGDGGERDGGGLVEGKGLDVLGGEEVDGDVVVGCGWNRGGSGSWGWGLLVAATVGAAVGFGLGFE